MMKINKNAAALFQKWGEWQYLNLIPHLFLFQEKFNPNNIPRGIPIAQPRSVFFNGMPSATDIPIPIARPYVISFLLFIALIVTFNS